MLNLRARAHTHTHAHIHTFIFSFDSYSFIILYFTLHEGHEETLCNYVGHCLVICLRVKPACKCIYIYDAENDERKRYTNTILHIYIYTYNSHNTYIIKMLIRPT